MINLIQDHIKTNNNGGNLKRKQQSRNFQYENNSNQTKTKINPNAYEEYQQKRNNKNLKSYGYCGGFMGLIIGLPSSFKLINNLKLSKTF